MFETAACTVKLNLTLLPRPLTKGNRVSSIEIVFKALQYRVFYFHQLLKRSNNLLLSMFH